MKLSSPSFALAVTFLLCASPLASADLNKVRSVLIGVPSDMPQQEQDFFTKTLADAIPSVTSLTIDRQLHHDSVANIIPIPLGQPEQNNKWFAPVQVIVATIDSSTATDSEHHVPAILTAAMNVAPRHPKANLALFRDDIETKLCDSLRSSNLTFFSDLYECIVNFSHFDDNDDNNDNDNDDAADHNNEGASANEAGHSKNHSEKGVALSGNNIGIIDYEDVTILVGVQGEMCDECKKHYDQTMIDVFNEIHDTTLAHLSTAEIDDTKWEPSTMPSPAKTNHLRSGTLGKQEDTPPHESMMMVAAHIKGECRGEECKLFPLGQIPASGNDHHDHLLDRTQQAPPIPQDETEYRIWIWARFFRQRHCARLIDPLWKGHPQTWKYFYVLTRCLDGIDVCITCDFYNPNGSRGPHLTAAATAAAAAVVVTNLD